MRSGILKMIWAASILATIMSANIAMAADPTTGQYMEFKESFSPNACFGTWGGSMNNGTQLIEWSCNPASAAKDQAWKFDTADCITSQTYGAFCSMRNGLNDNKCMGTYGGSTSQGAYMVLWDCLGQLHLDQYWQFQLDEQTGCYFIWNLKSALAVDAQWLQACTTWPWESDTCGPNHIWQEETPYQRWCPSQVTP